MQVLRDALINDRKFPSTYDFFIINCGIFYQKLFICYHDVLKLIFELYWLIFVDETNHTFLKKNRCTCMICGPFYLLMNPLCECLFRKTETREKELPEIFPFCSFRVTVWSQVFLAQWNVLWSVPFLPSPLCISWCKPGRCVYECVLHECPRVQMHSPVKLSRLRVHFNI